MRSLKSSTTCQSRASYYHSHRMLPVTIASAILRLAILKIGQITSVLVHRLKIQRRQQKIQSPGTRQAVLPSVVFNKLRLQELIPVLIIAVPHITHSSVFRTTLLHPTKKLVFPRIRFLLLQLTQLQTLQI